MKLSGNLKHNSTSQELTKMDEKDCILIYESKK